MTLSLALSELEEQIIALWACRLDIKDSARCLGMSPRQVQYYRSQLTKKLGARDFGEMEDVIIMRPDYDALTLMGQHLVVAYEMRQMQQRLISSQAF